MLPSILDAATQLQMGTRRDAVGGSGRDLCGVDLQNLKESRGKILSLFWFVTLETRLFRSRKTPNRKYFGKYVHTVNVIHIQQKLLNFLQYKKKIIDTSVRSSSADKIDLSKYSENVFGLLKNKEITLNRFSHFLESHNTLCTVIV